MKYLKLIIVVLTICICARLTLPYVLIRYAENKINKIPEYQVKISDLDLNLYRGSYTIKNIKLLKINKKIPVPYFEAQKVDLSIQWKALLHGSFVAKIIVVQPELNFVIDSKGQQEQLTIDKEWQGAVKSLFPLNINYLEVQEGKIALRNFNGNPPFNIYLQDVNFKMSNIQKITQKEDDNIDIQRIRIPVVISDQKTALIDTVTITAPPSKPGSETSKNGLHLVYFLGNGEYYEGKISEMYDYAQKLSVKNPDATIQVTAFNHPGVLNSTGIPKNLQDLIKTGQGVVTNLINKGANPESIILYGHSLGGVIATNVAANLHAKDDRVSLMNGRSLSDTSSFLAITNNFFGRAVMSNWSASAVKAFNKIPSQFKDYFLVRKPKSKDKYEMYDYVIRHEASLYKGLKKTHDLVPEGYKAKGFENNNLDKEERKKRKLEPKDPNDYNLHNVSLSTLADHNNETAKTKLLNFCSERYQASCVSYFKNRNKLKSILAVIENNDQDYKTHGGGNRYNNRLYAESALKIKLLIENCLEVHKKSKEGEDISDKKFEDIACQIEFILCTKLKETKGIGYFKFRKRDENTFRIYTEVLRLIGKTPTENNEHVQGASANDIAYNRVSKI